MAPYLFIAVYCCLSCVVSKINSIGITVSYVGKNLTDVPARSFKNGVDVSDKVIRLQLTNNSISRIPRFFLARYHNLQYLNLDGNKLTEVSRVAFYRTGLSGLFLSGNKLSCIPDLQYLHNSLQNLSISSNRLHECDKGYLYLRKFNRLSSISLEKNNLIHLRAMTILWSAPELTYVKLNDNELKQIPNFQYTSPNLHTFDLEGNPIECSCKIKWLKLIKYDGLRMLCKFDPILTTRWDTMNSLDLDFHCNSLTTWTFDNNSGKLNLL